MDKLTLGEVKCKKCKGEGRVIYNKLIVKEVNSLLSSSLECMCPKCFGTGKLDWIEVVTGKRGFSSSTSSSSPSLSSW